MFSFLANRSMTLVTTGSFGEYDSSHGGGSWKGSAFGGVRFAGNVSTSNDLQCVCSSIYSAVTSCLINQVIIIRKVGSAISQIVNTTFLFCKSQFFHISSSSCLPLLDPILTDVWRMDVWKGCHPARCITSTDHTLPHCDRVA